MAANGFPKVRFGVAWLRRRISERVVLINFVVVAEILAGFCLRFLRRGTLSGVFALVLVGATVPGMKIRAFPVLASTILLQWILVVSLPIRLQVSVSFPVPILVIAVVLFVEGFLVVFQVFPSRTLRT